MDITGDGMPDLYPDLNRVETWRGEYRNYAMDNKSFYLRDTISFGRFNVIAGLRYDHQTPKIKPFSVKALDRDNPAVSKLFTDPARNAIENILPGIDIPKIKATAAEGSDYAWRVWSPRLGITWDVSGDGKTVAKIFAGSYGGRMEQAEGAYWSRGGVSGWMHFWWLDNNGNGIADVSELYWHDSTDYGLYRAFDDVGEFTGDLDDAKGIMWEAYDPLDPLKTTDPYTLMDKKAGSTRTSELILTLEREILPDFAISLNLTYRRYDKGRWELWYYPKDYLYSGSPEMIESQDWYMSAGKPPASIPGTDPAIWDGNTGEASEHDWYVFKEEYPSTPWRFMKSRPDFYSSYWGIDFILNKRLSNKWILNGSLTVQDQKRHYGDKGYTNPTNLWALDGETYGLVMNCRWMFKVGGLYQLPYDFNIAFNFRAREGWPLLEYFDIHDPTLPNPLDRGRKATLLIKPFGSERIKMLTDLSFRFEKLLRIGDRGRLYIMVDAYNALNSKTINQRYDRQHGDYNVVSGLFSPDAHDYKASQILSPRMITLGVRFTF